MNRVAIKVGYDYFLIADEDVQSVVAIVQRATPLSSKYDGSKGKVVFSKTNARIEFQTIIIDDSLVEKEVC